MAGRKNRVQKPAQRPKSKSLKRGPTTVKSNGNGSSRDIHQREHRSISLSSGPNLADIPPYESPSPPANMDPSPQTQPKNERTTQKSEDRTSLEQERRELRPISGNEVVRESTRPKQEQQPQRLIQEARLPKFYSYDIEPQLLVLTKGFPAINPEYFQEIYENRFKPENLSKLSNSFEKSCLSTRKRTTIGESNRVVNVEPDAVIEDLQCREDLLTCFNHYRVALTEVVRLTQPANRHALDEAFTEYTHRLSNRLDYFPFEDVRGFHLAFHKKRAILGIDDPAGWRSRDFRLEQEFFRRRSLDDSITH